ncbi:fam-m protein [Plasmodium malariae]|uniref:Fam-m protein n=1 Tax=Plasmodium malariae TaxID=5858 RepID=A0A1D3JH52_PLAMA|nr:fam-m protein [Plasmodium malariae]SBT85616.1 fam-m protein [Plasmodium malariae]
MMEQKIKLISFNKTTMFFVLIWICNFNNDFNIFNKYLANENNFNKTLYTITYRLLVKYKEDKNSNITQLKVGMPDNWKSDKENISINIKRNKGKNKQSNSSLLNRATYYTEVVDYNDGMFDGKHFHFEKRWIKKKDYNTFLEKNNRIRDIALRKIKFRNYGFGVFIFFIFFLLGIGLPILKALPSYSALEEKLAFIKSFWDYIEKPFEYIVKKEEAFALFFFVLIIILGAILIIAIPKILRNNEKYKKIKLMTE